MKPRLPLLTLAVATLALLVHAVPSAADILQFNRDALREGEVWRWVSGHLTHFDLNHLAWDVGALLVLGTICEFQSRRRVVAALALAATAIPAALWFGQPQFEFYRGLSGLDSALFGLFATSLLRRQDTMLRLIGGAALLGFAAKCTAELVTHSTVFAAGDGYLPVPLAHLVGIAAGIAAGLLRQPLTSCFAASPATPRPCRQDRLYPARAQRVSR